MPKPLEQSIAQMLKAAEAEVEPEVLVQQRPEKPVPRNDAQSAE
jgi:hypothetical protein